MGGWELLRALEPVHPGTVNQWTNENVLFVCVRTKNEGSKESGLQ